MSGLVKTTVVNYWKKPLNMVYATGKIEVCPKCGRKGLSEAHTNEKTGHKWNEYTHIMEVNEYGRIILPVVKDFCTVPEKKAVEGVTENEA